MQLASAVAINREYVFVAIFHFFHANVNGNVSFETFRCSSAIQFASGNAFIATKWCIFDEYWSRHLPWQSGAAVQKPDSNLIRNIMWMEGNGKELCGCERNSNENMLIMQRRHSLYKWMRPCEQQLHAIRARGTNNNDPTTFLLRQRCGNPPCVATPQMICACAYQSRISREGTNRKLFNVLCVHLLLLRPPSHVHGGFAGMPCGMCVAVQSTWFSFIFFFRRRVLCYFRSHFSPLLIFS